MAVRGRQSAIPWVLAGVGLLSVVLVVGAGLRGQLIDHAVSIFLIAPQALLAGSALLVRSRSGGRARRFRLLLGLGLLIVFIGIVVTAVAPGASYPGPGDYVQGAAIPLLLFGLASAPRRTFERFNGYRLALEALMLGQIASVLYWRLAQRMIEGLTIGRGEVAVVTLSLICITAVALVALGSRHPGMLVATLGAAGVVIPDLIHPLTHGFAGGFVASIVFAVSWPMLTIGVLSVNAHPDETGEKDEIRWESVRYGLVSTLFLAMAVACLATLADQPITGALPLSLAASAVIASWLRELLRAHQLSTLLHQLGTLAHADHLTGLPNRRALEEELLRLSTRAGPVTILILDLDGFKSVNEQLGHEAGDQVLVAVAGIVARDATEAGAGAFRVGGDEFVVVSRRGRHATEQIAARILADTRLSALGVAVNSRVAMSVSIGLVHRDLGPRTEMDELLRLLSYAGMAMQTAKRDGSGQLVAYDSALEATSQRRLQIEQLLTDVVAGDKVDVVFEPIRCLSTGALRGVEALARWRDPVLGDVPPTEFILVAEERGLIHDLGDQILRRALAAAADARLAEHGVTMAVNVSALQLRARDFADSVVAALRDTGMPASALTIEVTESVFIRQDDLASRALGKLAEVGVGLALDDFGTGYSSIGYLARLPVSALKIDRSLTSRLADPSIRAVTRSVVDMAAALGLQVIVEGVETAADEEWARRLGADLAQGWHYGGALKPGELRRLVSVEPADPGIPQDDHAKVDLVDRP